MSRERSAIGALDAMLATVALVGVSVFFAMHAYGAPRFAGMYEDFGGGAGDALLTRIAISPVYAGGVAGVVLAACVGGAWMRHRGRPSGRALLLVAAALPVIAIALFVVGVYLPMFEVAEAVH